MIFDKLNGGYSIDNSMPEITKRYVSLLNRDIPQLSAFDTSHLSIIEDGRPGKYYSFGRRATNLQDWSRNASNSLINGRYKNLQNVTNFNLFKSGLKLKNYNTRPAFYNVEIGRGRDKDKSIINQWNRQHNLPDVASLNYNTDNNFA